MTFTCKERNQSARQGSKFIRKRIIHVWLHIPGHQFAFSATLLMLYSFEDHLGVLGLMDMATGIAVEMNMHDAINMQIQ